MSKGFLVIAQNTKDVNYVKQAYALALSIKHSQSLVTSISIITNDRVSAKYRKVFDNVIPIPWKDDAAKSAWKVENRWKLYYATPYDETIVLDTDMLILNDISIWWDYCSNFDVRFCSNIINYKQETVIQDTYHRKAFIANELTNPYFALHYFKKNEAAFEFYKVLEFVVNNWQYCYNLFAPINTQQHVSMDLSAAVAIEILGKHEYVIDACSLLQFVHMKLPLQNLPIYADRWTEAVSYMFNEKGELTIGNIKQSNVFHYVEKDFITDNILNKLERLANGK